MKLSPPSKTLFALLLAALVALPAAAETPEEKGLAIAKEADRRNDGFGDSKNTMEMVLRNKQGQESRPELLRQLQGGR